MIRIVFALIGSGIVRWALISVEEVPKALANMLTVLTFMSLVIMLPPFMDAVGDIMGRTGLNKVLLQIERVVDDVVKTVHEGADSVTTTIRRTFTLTQCVAAAYDYDRVGGYAWGTMSCTRALEKAREHCPSCAAETWSRGALAFVHCDNRRTQTMVPGYGWDLGSAEASALTRASQIGYSRHSCKRYLILHPVDGKIG